MEILKHHNLQKLHFPFLTLLFYQNEQMEILKNHNLQKLHFLFLTLSFYQNETREILKKSWAWARAES